jgi:hypothetical protein
MSAVALASAGCAVRIARAAGEVEGTRSGRPVGVRDVLAALSLKVESRDVLKVRKALVQSGAPSAHIMECSRLPHSTCCRLRLCCDRKWTGVVMRNIMQTVSAAEFGRCEPLPALARWSRLA